MKALTRSSKRLLGGVVACIGLTALALQPLAAHAATLHPVTTPGGTRGVISRGGPARHGTTMHESYRVFPGGANVPGAGSTTSVLLRGSTGRLTAPAAISGTIPGTAYRFLFWDIDGHLYTHRTGNVRRADAPSGLCRGRVVFAQGRGTLPLDGVPHRRDDLRLFAAQTQDTPGTPIAVRRAGSGLDTAIGLRRDHNGGHDHRGKPRGVRPLAGPRRDGDRHTACRRRGRLDHRDRILRAESLAGRFPSTE